MFHHLPTREGARRIDSGGMSFQNQPASRRALTQAQLAVHAARRHRVSVHRKTVTGIFVGGSLAAGAFTFLPGQLM